MASASLDAASTRNTAENTLQVPSSSTFSFKAPFPASPPSFSSQSALKQRRVSLALPSSPRVAWDFRDDTGLDSRTPETNETSESVPERRGKMRKLATGTESELSQEKKQRKKWSDEETQMLVLGCNRHGVGNWKTILSDRTLKFDNRSPVDLKDRFRTYYPDAYKQHYPNARTHLSSKVRSTLPDGTSLFEKTRSKKRRPFTEEEDRALKAGYEKHGTVWATIVKDPIFKEQGRRSTDLRDRFRNAFPELYQAAGYKPRNASKKKQSPDGAPLPVRAATDDQLSMSTTGPVRSRRRAHTSQGLLRGGTKSVPQSTVCSEDDDSSAGEEEGNPVFKTPHTPVFVDNVSTSSRSKKFLPFSAEAFTTDDEDMDMVTFDQLADPLAIPDYLPASSRSSQQSQYPNGMDAQSQTWSSSGVNTPTHSNHAWSTAAASPTSSHLSADYLLSASQSPSLQRRGGGGDPLSSGGVGGMIGKSAWGTQDWLFSANPRLDPEGSGNASSSPFPGGTGADGPLSPASPFSFHHLNHGVLDRYDLLPTLLPHDFSSEVGVGDTHSTFSDEMFQPNGFRGFTHHSSYAGDLIFGARTHQPQQQSFASLNNSYSTGFEFGTPGLGLSGMSQTTGIHPMQLALPGIDEIELTGITLDDNGGDGAGMVDGSGDIELDMDTQQQPKNNSQESSSASSAATMSSSEQFSLDDLVDLSAHDLEQHSTPPGTPLLLSPSRHPSRSTTTTTRRSSESAFRGYHGTNSGMHGRSISVPPSEARVQPDPASTSVSRPAQPQHVSSQPVVSTVRSGVGTATQHYLGSPDPSQSFNSLQLSPPSSRDNKVLGTNNTPSTNTPLSHQHQHHQPLSAYPTHMLLPSLSQDTYSWRSMALGDLGNNNNNNSNLNLSFLDLHYYGHVPMAAGGVAPGPPEMGGGEAHEAQLRQGQALDLAQSFVSSSSSSSLTSLAPSAFKSATSLVQHMSHAMGGGELGGRGGGGGFKRSGFSGRNGHEMVMTPTASKPISHHRGQSAVNPQDLMLRHDNKRKRASWDGAHS